MLPVLYTVACPILYCATPAYTAVGADAARVLYSCLRDPLLCYPPPTLLLGVSSLCSPLHYT